MNGSEKKRLFVSSVGFCCYYYHYNYHYNYYYNYYNYYHYYYHHYYYYYYYYHCFFFFFFFFFYFTFVRLPDKYRSKHLSDSSRMSLASKSCVSAAV